MLLVIFYALSAVIGPFVGQNLSAGKEDRIYRSLRLCSVFCLSTGVVIAGFLAAMSGILPSLFSSNPAVTDVATLFLLIAPVSYGAHGIVMVMNASFNGMGKPMPAVVVSVSRMAVIYLPLAFLLNKPFGIAGIFSAYAVANIISAVLAYSWAHASVKAQCQKHAVAQQHTADFV